MAHAPLLDRIATETDVERLAPAVIALANQALRHEITVEDWERRVNMLTGGRQ